jgi:DMSO/TMAO reductase YedYZ molybdopterin-dependent catalytic subunit
MRHEEKVREQLPVHSRPDDKALRNHVLRIDGLVENCLALTPADLKALPQEDLVEGFTCREGWSVPNLRWSGVALEAVFPLARPHPNALHVQASAGDFSISLPIERAKRVLLALRLNEDWLPLEHGGSVRLVVSGGDCFMSIKWLDHLELRSEPGPNTAKTIALARLSSGAARHPKSSSDVPGPRESPMKHSVGGVISRQKLFNKSPVQPVGGSKDQV